jgi:hypothetical protein
MRLSLNLHHIATQMTVVFLVTAVGDSDVIHFDHYLKQSSGKNVLMGAQLIELVSGNRA